MNAMGQRYWSQQEGQLGLGIVTDADIRRICIFFPREGIDRTYALDNAPLIRAVFHIGDQVLLEDGQRATVTAIDDNHDLLIYQLHTGSETVVVPETRLSPDNLLAGPRHRLDAGHSDKAKVFGLRWHARHTQQQTRAQPWYGLTANRVQLLAHQCYVAHQLTQRTPARALLADEVGLGKTIEAGHVIKRWLELGLHSRILLVVPDALQHQWLAEMLQRFYLRFHMLNHQDELDSETLSAHSLVLVPFSLAKQNGTTDYLLAEQWDALIVDEAHQQALSYEQRAIWLEDLSAHIENVLLLTATPEQFGNETLFTLLHWVAPHTFTDLHHFHQQQAEVHQLSHLASLLLTDERPSAEQFARWFTDADSDASNQELLQSLLARHSSAGVMFRNSRRQIGGFPTRNVELHDFASPYQLGTLNNWRYALTPETFSIDESWTGLDPRVLWLQQFAKSHRSQKTLVLCRHAATVQAIAEFFRQQEGWHMACFHAEQSTLERDRVAAYFAEPDCASPLLLSDDIGAEGRNFQHCQNLVFFDLVPEPDRIEQRIGRLDRIGQRDSFNIHVLYFNNSAQDLVCRFLHQGLNAFNAVTNAGSAIWQHYAADFADLIGKPQEWDNWLQQVQQHHNQLAQDVLHGQDKLLELSSSGYGCRPAWLDELADIDASQPKQLMLDMLEYAGVEIDDDEPVYILRPSEDLLLPGLPDEGMTATFDRPLALLRDDYSLLCWQHPLITAIRDHLQRADGENLSLGVIFTNDLPAGTIVVECAFNCDYPQALDTLVRHDNALTPLLWRGGKQGMSQVQQPIDNSMLGNLPKKVRGKALKMARPVIDVAIEQATTAAQQHYQQLLQQQMPQWQHRLQRLIADAAHQHDDDLVELLQTQLHLLDAQHPHWQIRLDAIRVLLANPPSA